VSGHARQTHRRSTHWAEHDSPLVDAFLIALGQWILKHEKDPEAEVTLPTGRVGVGELTAVLRGLEVARRTERGDA
jgi:hypothetical protein